MSLLSNSLSYYLKKKKKNTAASSDKLSALPSHLHSSPTLRALGAGTRRNRSNSGSPEGASLDFLPSSSTITQEAHAAQVSTLPRRAPSLSPSLSDSAAQFSTTPLQRQRISFDSEKRSSPSPRAGEFLSVLTHIFTPSSVTCSWSEDANAQLNEMTYS